MPAHYSMMIHLVQLQMGCHVPVEPVLLLHLFQRQMDHRPSDAPLFFLAVPVEPIKDWFHFAFYDAVRLFSRQKSACSLVESN